MGVPGFAGLLGLLVFLAGSGYLARSPIHRDAVLPLMLALAGPPVGLLTVGVLYLMWLPDACSTTTERPVNTVNGRSGRGQGGRLTGHRFHAGQAARLASQSPASGTTSPGGGLQREYPAQRHHPGERGENHP